MAPMPVPPADGVDDDPVSGLQQGLRLSDAEEIAARRLDVAAEGSLREALAIAAAANAGDAAPQPTNAVGPVGESFASRPLVRLIDVRSAEIGPTQASKSLDPFSPMPMPPMLDLGIAVVTPVDSVAPPAFATPGIADDGEPVFMPTEDRRGVVADTPAASAMAPLPEVTAAQSIEPLTSALDAAVRLAADASVAAEALENLKRLLERKQQLESQLPHLAADSQPTSASDDADASAPAPQQPLPPLPLPLHAEQDAAGGSAASTTVLPPPPWRRRRPPPERRVFDLRGFMAGFALSWAFGVVLYLFMTAG
jgi:hypothetical protein